MCVQHEDLKNHHVVSAQFFSSWMQHKNISLILVLKTYIENCSCWSRRDSNFVSVESEQIHLWSNIISDDNWKISKSLCRFLSMLFNNTVSCRDYVASVINEWMIMVHWWHDTESRKLKYFKKNLSQCHTVCYESHMD